MLLGYTSCSDDHFDIQNDVPAAGNTLWQNIESTKELSDFKDILGSIRVYTKEDDTKPSITYADLLKQSQAFTLWAPLNGTYDAQSYKDKIAEIESIRQQAAQLQASISGRNDEGEGEGEGTGEGEGGNEDTDNTAEIQKQVAQLYKRANTMEYNLGVQFAQNHIARFNYEMNNGEQNVRLMNGKICSYNAGAGLFNGVALYNDLKTIPSSNGTIHVLNGVAPFAYNVYEYMEAYSDLFSNVYNTIVSYDKNTFSPGSSTPGAMNENGEMVYVDSVYFNQNELLNQSYASIKNEDSLYVAVIPSDQAWSDALLKVKPLFNYATKYNYDYKNIETQFASQLTKLNADSLSEYNLRKSLITSMYFSPSIFGQKFDRNDLQGIANYAEHADSLITTNGVVYYNPNAATKGKNPLFSNVDYVKASNGIIYPLASYDLDPSYSFVQRKYVDVTQQYNVGYVKNCGNGSYGERITLTAEGDYANLNPNVDISEVEDGVYRYFKVNGTQALSVYIPLRGLYSTKYRIRVQLLPNNAYLTDAWIDQPATEDEPETYLPQNTKFEAQLFDDEGNAIVDPEGNKKTPLITIEEDAAKYYTLWEEIEIPKCYVGLPSGVNNTFPMLVLSVTPARQEQKKKQHALSIAKVVVEPVHPVDVQ